MERSWMNEKKVTDIFNNVNIILWTYDISSGKMTISGDLMNFCGFSSEEITKEPGNWTKYIHPEDFKILNEIYKKIILNEITVKELRIIRPNGQIMCLHVKVIPILDHSGIITRIDGITIDTTEKKSEALQSEIPLSNKINNKLNLLINRVGIITNVSNFNETNADEVSNHLLNKSIFSFFSGEQLQKIKKYFAEVKTGRGQTFKTVMKTEHSIVYQLDIKVLTV